MSDLTLQTPVRETPANTSAARVPSDSLPGLKGMWVAVCLEYLEFTMFFSVYFVARWFHPQAFQEGAARLWTWGGVAVTLVTKHDQRLMGELEKLLKTKVELEHLAFEEEKPRGRINDGRRDRKSVV